MADETFIEPSVVLKTAGTIPQLLSDTSSFEHCASIPTKAGNFQAALTLEQVVHARQSGLLQHVSDLQTALQQLGDNLTKACNTLVERDQDNAGQLEPVVTSPTFNDYVPTL
ncbi:DUF2563 family protein [Lentzea sp. BCCO 10_0798]|uniref:DUF2563 family protein n=1 Tax=Lentzea kristufekii TaxID=3095430 RepID=A0ABU4U721_9PSEU|nr:DUF2563 family protein [Lentzea sp. BCCO 10_0798]MDX8056145.1 DUF2563 family protein [Lentzea sp. BCCO 10_0798]